MLAGRVTSSLERRVVRSGAFGPLRRSAGLVLQGHLEVVVPSLEVEEIYFGEVFVESDAISKHLILYSHAAKVDEALFGHIRAAVAEIWPGFHASFVSDYYCDAWGADSKCWVHSGRPEWGVEIAAAVAERERSGRIDDFEHVSITVDGVLYDATVGNVANQTTCTILVGAG